MRAAAPDPQEVPTAALRMGVASGWALLWVGGAYLTVIAAWLVLERTPAEPIGDPYLAAMEVLTLVSALAILGLVVALAHVAAPDRRPFALAALATGALAAGTTMAVHLVQLSAVRQMWRAGQVADYRLVWPSILFAVEYVAWDVFVGLTLVLSGVALAGVPEARAARRAHLLGGALCLVGILGPLSGRMALQTLAVVGYALVLPVAGALTARALGDRPGSHLP